MSLRVLIVDDEPLARERLRGLLEKEPGVEVAGECGDGTTAVAAIRESRPDVVFLDVQMPGMDGFEVVRALDGQSHLPLIVFVTAYDQHAVKAFEVHALDYLLKPFKPARLKQSLERARKDLAGRQSGAATSKLLEWLSTQSRPEPERLARLPVRNGDRVVFVKTQDIDYIEAAGNYLVVHVGKDNHVLRETLAALEEKLDPRKFLRISRSTIVNIDQIKELQPMFKGEHAVILRNGKQLNMTRGLREVQEFLKFA